MKFKQLLLVITLLVTIPSKGQITLLGDNAPFKNINDGDFAKVKGYWRAKKQSPHWKTQVVKGKGPIALHKGMLYSMAVEGVAESDKLNTNLLYPKLKEGDVWNWEFGADLEYICDGYITLSLVFDEKERVLAKKIKLKGADKKIEHFKGSYKISKEDVKGGFPYVRVTFYSEQDVKVYLDYVNISVQSDTVVGPNLELVPTDETIKLKWIDRKLKKGSVFTVYRSKKEMDAYIKLGTTDKTAFLDTSFVHGVDYKYVVTRTVKGKESVGSNKVFVNKKDKNSPKAPIHIKAKAYETEIEILWQKNKEKDIAYYAVFRGDKNGENLQEIGHQLKRNKFVDFTPQKEKVNTYFVVAYDYSGNKSELSQLVSAKVKAVLGTSFSDLILPMPIHNKLTSNTWGAPGVVPRDVDNGIESENWSYWGGRPVEGKDGKYHICVTRWPANATRGHWEWPHSTVAYAVSDKPTGPYNVKREFVYTDSKGKGHNPDIILLNDGTYLLYSLVNWEAVLFQSNSMEGPWKRLGVMEVDWKATDENPKLAYRFYRNLSGIQLKDGRFLFVTKAGAMMVSKGENPLGPYKVLTKPLRNNPIIPEKYRKSNYEDPVLWKDEVQYHMIINAFLDYRAIYLRSPDGIHWKFNSGTAYTPNNTWYENGKQTHWYKLERPHVLTDVYGRATHLSLAVIDVPKEDDLARDNHSSKNIIIPLTVHKRISVLNKERVSFNTKEIKLLIRSEEGFNAQRDIDIKSLSFGVTENVDIGNGAKVVKTKNKGKDLILVFKGVDTGISDKNFVGKLLGKTSNGNLLIGYCKLLSE